MSSRATALVVLGAVFAGPSTAGAQSANPEPLLLGPVSVSPRVALSDLGLDTNVFNDHDDPKSDVTYTVSPLLTAAIEGSRADLVLESRVDFVHFTRYADQRATNSDTTLTIGIPFNRLRVIASSSYVRAKRRPNSEIDTRPQRRVGTVTVGGEVRVSGVSTLGFEARESRIEFAEDEVFDGEDLRRRLNRDEQSLVATAEYALSPLTTVELSGDVTRTEFAEAPERDSDSMRILSGLRFAPSAFLTGHATVGLRTLAGPLLPNFSGLVASSQLTYAPLPATAVSAQVQRDLAYSYRADASYYLRTRWSGALRQRFWGRWAIEARGSRENLDYTSALEVSGVTPYVETLRGYGAGLGYDAENGARVQVDVDYRRRSSRSRDRTYRGISTGLSASFPF